MNIIIADDHPIVLSGIKMLIEHPSNEFNVIAEATDVETLLLQLKQYDTDILITDYSMPHSECVDGIAMIKKIQRQYPLLKIIVLTQIANPALLNALIESGVSGLLLKKDMLSDIHQVLTTVKSGKRYISQNISNLLFDHKNNPLQPTIKELEVLRMLSTGMSVSEIATYTNRSIKTISTQKKKAMAKLGLESDSAIYEYVKNFCLI